MKIGDKVYCIKTYIDQNRRYVHLKNNFYTIYNIDNILTNTERVWINSEPNTTSNGYLGYIKIGKLYSNFHYFKDHFITIKELRKQKLKKIQKKFGKKD